MMSKSFFIFSGRISTRYYVSALPLSGGGVEDIPRG